VAECEAHPCSGVVCGKGAECASQLRPRGLLGVCRSCFVHIYLCTVESKRKIQIFRRFSLRPSISPMRNVRFFFSRKNSVICARSFRKNRHPRSFRDLLKLSELSHVSYANKLIYVSHGELFGTCFVSITRVTCGSKLSMFVVQKVQRGFAILYES
jgi:hypothetical protein